MDSQLVLPNWVKLGKNVWAAELSDADSQPTKRTLRMFYTCYAKVIPARTWFRKRSGYLSAFTDTGFGGPKYGFPASAAKRGVKGVWAAEPCGADSQPTFGTFSRWFIRHKPTYLR